MRFAIVLLAACGGASLNGHEVQTGPTCVQAATNERYVRDRAEQVMGGEKHHALTAEEKAQHCKDDGWSAETIKCFAETTDWEQMKLCYDTMTSEQTGEIIRAIKAKPQ
jgi:hypothetical protein